MHEKNFFRFLTGARLHCAQVTAARPLHCPQRFSPDICGVSIRTMPRSTTAAMMRIRVSGRYFSEPLDAGSWYGFPKLLMAMDFWLIDPTAFGAPWIGRFGADRLSI